jgi:hypothetical protein
MEDYKMSKIVAPGQRVCFWGARESAHLASGDLQAQLVLSGNNSGNIFIGAGLFRNLDCALKEYHPGFGTIPPEELHERYDYMFIAASNFVSAGVDLTSAYDYLKKSKVKLFCFGLGSQFLPDQPVELNPGTEAFLRLLGERSGSIGVRGAFTAELLWKLGIRNLSLTGCPSLLSLTPEAMKRLTTERPSLDKIAFNASTNVRRHALAPEALGYTENALFRRLLEKNSFYVLQNEQPEMQALSAENEAKFAHAMSTVRYIFNVKDIAATVDPFFRTQVRMFFDVDGWVGCMRTMTASIGSRFHGNIAAILAGTPALTLAHDMRTKELCETFSIPHVMVDQNFEGEDLVDRMLEVDYEPFRKRLNHMQAEWKLFLYRNGLDFEGNNFKNNSVQTKV